MTKELYINGELVDLPKNIVALTYAVNTLNEVKTLNGNISNRIDLPPTMRNLKLLGYVGDTNVDLSKTIRKKLTCRYVQNGVEIIPEGVVQIGTITKKGLGIFVTSGNVDFFDLIDGSIQDLDFSEYNHVYGFGIIDARTNRAGYIYPVVNYGDMTDATVYMNIMTMRPAMFVKTVAEKIVTEAGFELINEIEVNARTADQYARMILPFANDSFIHGQRFIDQNKTYELSVVQNAPRNYNMTTGAIDEDYALIKYNTVIKDALSRFSDEGIYNIPASSTRFIADIQVTIPRVEFAQSGSNRVRQLQLVKKNEFDLVTVLANVELTAPDVIPLYVYENINIKVDGIVIGGGVAEKYYLRFNAALVGGGSHNMYVPKPITFKITSVGGNVELGDNVELEATLPDISKKDFLKAVANFFGGIVQTNNQEKTVSIVPFFKIVENVPLAVDWSTRIVNETEQSNEVSIGEYGQNNVAFYNNDDAIENKDEFANGMFQIADENLQITKEFFDVPFSASYDGSVSGGIPAIQITKITTEGGTAFETSTEPRIAMVEFIDTEMRWRKNGEAGFTVIQYDSIPTTYFNGGGLKKGLMMQEILDRYYAEIITMLNDQRKKIIPLNLNDVDIASLDFFKPVYLDLYASYFYISKIKDYTGVKPCNTELIKLF